MRKMSIGNEHARFLGAMFIMTVAHQASSMIDAAIGGHALGENVVSAINLVLPLEELFFALSLLLGMGACTAAAISFGKGEMVAVRRHFSSAVVSAAALFSVLVLALFFMREQVMDVLCGDSFLRDDTRRYMVSLLPCLLFGNLATIISEFVAMTGSPFQMTYCALAFLVTKFLADFLFVWVLGLGVGWLGFASLLASLAALAIMLPYCLRKDSPLRFILCGFRELMCFVRTNVHFGKGLLTVELSYIVFNFAMNSLVLRYLGEKEFFCWSVVMMIYLVGDYAAAAAQDTCLSLGGKFLGAGMKDNVSLVFRRSMTFAALWIVLCLTMVFALPDLVLPLFGATDRTNYPRLLSVITLTLAVPAGMNLVNLFLVRLVMMDRMKRFMLLIAVLYLSAPLFLFSAHLLSPGNEWLGMLALLPLQVVLVFLGRMRCK